MLRIRKMIMVISFLVSVVVEISLVTAWFTAFVASSDTKLMSAENKAKIVHNVNEFFKNCPYCIKERGETISEKTILVMPNGTTETLILVHDDPEFLNNPIVTRNICMNLFPAVLIFIIFFNVFMGAPYTIARGKNIFKKEVKLF